jgi:hypothetical protein
MALTVTANLKNLTNASDVGWATFTLCGYGSDMPRTSGAVFGVTWFRAVADGSGVITLTIAGNDVVTPAGTVYMVEVFTSGGAVFWAKKYRLTGSGTVDLSTQSPL